MGLNNSKILKTGDDKTTEYKIEEPIELITAPPIPLEEQTLFDGTRGPFSVKTGKINQDVLEYILQDNFLLQPAEGLLSSGFIVANDYRTDVSYIPKRYKYEGFFHTLAPMESITAMQARTGVEHEKPSATLPTKSFVRSIIMQNKAMLDEITNIFPPHSTLRHLFEDRKILGEAAIEITHGDAAGPPYIGMHIDNLNSILHLALSIKGDRTLHIGYADKQTSQYTLKQSTSDFYLSSPWAFHHAIQFPEQSWDQRVIAIQFRTIHTTAENKSAFEELEDRKFEFSSAMSTIMEKYPLIIPTLKDVKEMENSLVIK